MAESQELSARERWGFKTNAVDWLFTIPNIGIEYDLGNDTRSKHTLNANLKWNWNTSHKYLPANVFNLFDARVEWRQYFRTRQRNGAKATLKDGFKNYFRNRLFTTLRHKPRDYRAYYWGVYANASSYNIKIGKQGKQGTAYGAGLSLGYTAPLYGYGSEGGRRGFVDLELGGAIGLLFTSYDVYEHDPESNCYPIVQEKCKGGHLVPFPVATDLRVAFVYRFISVKNKYLQTVDSKRRYNIRQEVKRKEEERISLIKVRLDSLQSAVKRRGEVVTDSMLTKEEQRIWHAMQTEQQLQAKQAAAEKLRKQMADSLGINLTDSLSADQEKKLRRAVEQAQAKQEKESKKAVQGKEGKEEKKDKDNKEKKNKEAKPKKEKKGKGKKDDADETSAPVEETPVQPKEEEEEAL